MRIIKPLLILLIAPLLAGVMLAGLMSIAHTAQGDSAPLPSAANPAPPLAADNFDTPQLPAVRPSLRISIPYGFAPNLPLRVNGQEVWVSGHGSCTSGETFSVAVTITHDTTGDMATGNLTEACAGEATRQTWQLTATALSDPLTLGLGESCGFVQTMDGDAVTDEQEWCVAVKLGDYLYLPVVSQGE